MKCYITTTSFGFIATNQDNEIIDYRVFEKKQVEKLLEIQKKQLLQEEVELIESVGLYYDEIVIETSKARSIYSHLNQYDKIITENTTKTGKYIRNNLEEILTDIPELKKVDVRRNLNNTYTQIAKDKIRESIKTNDVMIVETINSLEEIEEIEKWEGNRINEAKEVLAFELTKLVHSEEEAIKAQESSRALFSGAAHADMPTTEIEEADLTDGVIDLISLLVKAELAPTRSEARRNIEQGGVTVDGEKVSDVKATFTKDALAGDGMVIKRGKKKFKKVVLK